MSGFDLTTIHLSDDVEPFTVAIPVDVIAEHWMAALNDHERVRVLWMPVILGHEGEIAVERCLIDIRRAVAVHGVVLDDVDPVDVAAAISDARAKHPDLFLAAGDIDLLAAEKKLRDAGLVDLRRVDPDPGVPEDRGAGGRPRRGVDFGMYEKPEAPDGPPA